MSQYARLQFLCIRTTCKKNLYKWMSQKHTDESICASTVPWQYASTRILTHPYVFDSFICIGFFCMLYECIGTVDAHIDSSVCFWLIHVYRVYSSYAFVQHAKKKRAPNAPLQMNESKCACTVRELSAFVWHARKESERLCADINESKCASLVRGLYAVVWHSSWAVCSCVTCKKRIWTPVCRY